jgi:nicotinamidase/pyrazinamidase
MIRTVVIMNKSDTNEQTGERRVMAVIVIDVQGDFTEFKSGSLPVPGTGADYVRNVEMAIRTLRNEDFLIIATRDWHPKDHISFHTTHPGKKAGDITTIDNRTQTLWPPHCVEGTENALVLIESELLHCTVSKGHHPKFDSYSAFQDDGGNETELNEVLRENKIEKLVLFGLATDYCVKDAALDALRRGYKVVVIKSLCRGITPESSDLALAEMEREGAIILKNMDVETLVAF